ncbi:MAG: hypothetical protein K5891_07060 [Lachnospiraceae bacterium]|nr:hypothetical protein [Lachnospiraceae bacterium]
MNKKPYLITTIVYGCLLLLCIGLFLTTRGRTFSYEGSGAAGPSYGEENTEIVLYTGIRLFPGIYHAELQYQTDTFFESMCMVRDLSLPYLTLQTIGDPLTFASDRTDFTFYLYYPSDALEVYLTTNGLIDITTGDLTITDTGKLWSVCGVLVLLFYCITIAIVRYRELDKTQQIRRENKTVCVILSALCILSSLSFLYHYMFLGADTGYHLHRIEGIMNGLSAGIFPTRIEPHWLQGHGYANGIFYCPLFLLPSALLRLAGFPVTVCWNVYGILASCALVFVAYGCFRSFLGEYRIALLCTSLYSMSVIHFYKLVETSAIGEGTAMIFLPAVLLGFYRILFDDVSKDAYKKAFLPLGLGYAGILQCHVLTTEMTAFISCLLVICLLPRLFADRGKRILALVKAAATALVLSCWFVVPFLDYYLHVDLHIKNVFARTIQEHGLQIGQLLFPFWTGEGETLAGGMYHAYPSGLGLGVCIGLGLFLTLWVTKKLPKDGLYRFSRVCALLGIFLAVLTLESFPWNAIQNLGGPFKAFVSSLQFPNRFLGWSCLLMILCFGVAMGRMIELGDVKMLRLCTCVVTLSVLGSAMYLTDHFNSTRPLTYLSNPEGMGTGYISGGEYVIQGTDEYGLRGSAPTAGEGVTITSAERGALRASAVCTNAGAGESWVEFALLYYPGYRAVDGNGNALTVEAGSNFVVRVLLPAGFDGSVTVRFVSPVSWRIAEIVSALGLVVLIAWGLWRKRMAGAADSAEADFDANGGVVHMPAVEAIASSGAQNDSTATAGADVLHAGSAFSPRGKFVLTMLLILTAAWLPYLSNYISEGIYTRAYVTLFFDSALLTKAIAFLVLTVGTGLILTASMGKGFAVLFGKGDAFMPGERSAAVLAAAFALLSPGTLQALYLRGSVSELLRILLLTAALCGCLRAWRERAPKALLFPCGCCLAAVFLTLIDPVQFFADADSYRIGTSLRTLLALFPEVPWGTMEGFVLYGAGLSTVVLLLSSAFLLLARRKGFDRTALTQILLTGAALVLALFLGWVPFAGGLRTILAGYGLSVGSLQVILSAAHGYALMKALAGEGAEDSKLRRSLFVILLLLTLCSGFYFGENIAWTLPVYLKQW